MEIWKDIKGYEGLYQVSNLGNVKKLEYTSIHIWLYTDIGTINFKKVGNELVK